MSTYYVGLNGINSSSYGRTKQKPWRTLFYAISKIPDDGSQIIILPGIYKNPAWRVSRKFATPVVVWAEIPYHTNLTNSWGDPVLKLINAAKLEFKGFLFGPTKSRIGVEVTKSEDIIFENCIFRDSYNNDCLKFNNRCLRPQVYHSVFYNQGSSDELIDCNSSNDAEFAHNIFFGDYASSGRTKPGSRSHVVFKNSGAKYSAALINKYAIRLNHHHNIHLNYQGVDSANFVRCGEDGFTEAMGWEAQQINIEDNVMIGNSSMKMDSPICFQNARYARAYRNMFVHPMPAKLQGIRLRDRHESITIGGNLWHDPILSPIVLPRWMDSTKRFKSGKATIVEEYARLKGLVT